MPSPRLATPSTPLPPAPVAQGLPRGAWHYQWSFFDPQRGAWRAARVETHQAALAAAPAAAAAAAAALVRPSSAGSVQCLSPPLSRPCRP